MEPQLWGRQGWHFLHAVTLSYPERPTLNQQKRMANFFNELQYVLPCRVCQKNFQNHMKQIPIQSFLQSRKELVKWLHTIHNLTNTMLGKPQYPLEKNYTKEEILSMYLNKFDFLNNAVGINSAAQVYFNKLPKELDLHESAMLIGMAKNPSLFNPVRRPDTVLKRRTVVLFQMYKNNYITKEVFDSTKKLELDLDYNKVDHQTGLAPYFREILRLELGKILSEKNENDEYIIKNRVIFSSSFTYSHQHFLRIINNFILCWITFFILIFN